MQNLVRKEFTRDEITKILIAEWMPLGSGWGSPLYKSPAWNVPQDQYVRRNTDVCEDVMYHRLLCTLHPLLLAERPVLERWALGLRKVMLYCSK